MSEPTVAERFLSLEERESPAQYNYTHFRLKHILLDARRLLLKRGIAPGDWAPDFELPCAGGGTLRLRDLRGKPVLLHFG